MKKIARFIFPEWEAWEDVSCYERSGRYILLQMRKRKKDNKKKFRRAKMGFINDFSSKGRIFERVINKTNLQ
jgi:hypothetical protein